MSSYEAHQAIERAFLKDKAFSHEQEIRIVTMSTKTTSCVSMEGKRYILEEVTGKNMNNFENPGLYVCTRLHRLITEVVVAPNAQDWFEKLIRCIVERNNIPASISRQRAVATVNVDHNIFKHMLNKAMKRDLVTRNVATLVAAPKPKNARNRVLEAAEWTRLYTAAPAWFQPVLLTGYHTGMRLEEILTLTWDRVDLEKGRIFLPGHLTKTKEDRSVPMTPSLRQEFKRLRASNGVTRIQGLVFQRDGQKLNHTYRVVQDLCREQKIPDFVFHDLRHCAVTNLADAGVDTETIMKIVGHSSVEMFLRYRTVRADRLDEAMAQLDAAINTPVTPRSARISNSATY